MARQAEPAEFWYSMHWTARSRFSWARGAFPSNTRKSAHSSIGPSSPPCASPWDPARSAGTS